MPELLFYREIGGEQETAGKSCKPPNPSPREQHVTLSHRVPFGHHFPEIQHTILDGGYSTTMARR